MIADESSPAFVINCPQAERRLPLKNFRHGFGMFDRERRLSFDAKGGQAWSFMSGAPSARIPSRHRPPSTSVNCRDEAGIPGMPPIWTMAAFGFDAEFAVGCALSPRRKPCRSEHHERKILARRGSFFVKRMIFSLEADGAPRKTRGPRRQPFQHSLLRGCLLLLNGLRVCEITLCRGRIFLSAGCIRQVVLRLGNGRQLLLRLSSRAA